ncbi:MmgE/PrpD family protein [Bacillus timonensis]|uniref:MmgE/PrpD family protein n=1 Tax=Bacillus timonensis TaxID=1033734 RepID=UPI0013869AEA|nr:MmgE/PrpD family protein [Bacillus timonensis]
MSTIARDFANYFINEFKYEDIPSTTIEGIKVLMMDYLGVALKGTLTETGEITRSYFADKGGRGEATLFDSNIKVPAESAAFANAVASHSIELDDIDRLALFHFSPPIYSAAFAIAEKLNVSGKDFITALAAGVEMMERLSLAMNPSLRNRGFHTTPTLGIFGATVASALMMKLTEEQIVSAFGLSGSQVAGMLEMYGESMQKRFNPGPAAHNSIVSVNLAQRGFTGADTIFEGKRGICRSYSDEVDWSKLKSPKQGDYIFEIELKPYACARPIHAPIDAALGIRKQILESGKQIRDIKKVDVFRHPAWADYHTNQEPKSYHDAQVSMCFSVALGLVTGANFFEDYIEAVGNRNQDVYDISKKVSSICDPEFPNSTGCWAVATLKDGTEIKVMATYPKGSIENPMTPEERRYKFNRLTNHKLSEQQGDQLAEIINNLESYNVTDILDIINK